MAEPQGSPIISVLHQYNKSNPDSSERTITQCLIDNFRQIPNWTIEELSLACNISVSTCRRFLKSLGYTSFSAFRFSISEELRGYDFQNPPRIDARAADPKPYVQEYLTDISSTLKAYQASVDYDVLMHIVRLLHACDRIYIHDMIKGGMNIPLERDLALSGKQVIFSHTPESQRRDALAAGEKDLFLLMNDGQLHSIEMINTIKTVHKKHCTIIVISNRPSFPGADLCSAVLYIPGSASAITSVLMQDVTYQFIDEIYKSLYVNGTIG